MFIAVALKAAVQRNSAIRAKAPSVAGRNVARSRSTLASRQCYHGHGALITSVSALPGSAKWLVSSHRLPNHLLLLRSAVGGGAVRAASTFTVTPMGRSKSTVAVVEECEEDYEHFDSSAAGAAHSSKSHKEEWMVNLGRNGGADDAWLDGPRGAGWFTGVRPSECPGVDAEGKIRSLPLPNLSTVTRAAAREYFDNSWTLYETMFAGLKGEDPFYRPPVHGLRHPQIFYYGHTACLYINKLRVSGVLEKPVNAYFESIFEVGVDEMLWDDMHKNDMVWPMVSEVHEYRRQVYETVIDAIESHPSLNDEDGVVVNQDHPMWALFMGFEHERIHLETSSVLFRETPLHLVQSPENWPQLHPSASRESPASNPKLGSDYPLNPMIPVSGNSIDLGKPADFPSYGWDNEYGERKVDVPDFLASENMVTNGEFWQFVADGGYRTKEYWCDDGWAWRKHRNMKWPFFWEPAGPAGSHEYNLRTIFQEVGMQWDWPVDVNYYEAKAFCKWKTEKEGSPYPYRILTEAEHHLMRPVEHDLQAARKDVSADKVMITSGSDFARGPTGANLNLAYSSQNPVDSFPKSSSGHRDVTGNAWEWTEDHFNPLKGFEVHHVYDDFSTPCFDGKHSMIVGGSFMSTGDEASVFARFHFRPHFLQHSGFRLVASKGKAPARHLFPGNFAGQAAAREEAVTSTPDLEPEMSNVYETNELLDMYLGLHYPSSGKEEGVDSILPHSVAPTHGLGFPQRVAELLCSLKPQRLNNRALDIGCGVGGMSFELAKTFDHVEAFDFSESFISAAEKMKNNESIKFRIPIEADIAKVVKAVHDDGMTADILKKVHFFAGDACELKKYASDIGSFDAAIMSNLLCRLPDPVACLDALPHVVNKGGIVVLVTPFSWLEQFTPRGKWLGGYNDPVSGQPCYSKDKLREIMEANGFEKIHEEEMPVVIREHQRKYQYIISEATGWRRI